MNQKIVRGTFIKGSRTILKHHSSPNNSYMQNSSLESMKTLASCINKLVIDGYTEDFKVSGRGLLSLQHEKLYRPEDIEIVNFFRFEGASDPSDNAILYVIETNDKIKGTLVDAYGAYADPEVSKFMEEIQMSKKTIKG
jgi:hypothetical protein